MEIEGPLENIVSGEKTFSQNFPVKTSSAETSSNNIEFYCIRVLYIQTDNFHPYILYAQLRHDWRTWLVGYLHPKAYTTSRMSPLASAGSRHEATKLSLVDAKIMAELVNFARSPFAGVEMLASVVPYVNKVTQIW